MKFRSDIQALRGYAVGIVLLSHAGFGPKAGYLGVDVFFVISGYLITRMITSEIQEKSFKFTEFYFRRAKRLLPAAYATFFVTILTSPWVLGSLELKDLYAQVVGALTFTINIVLWGQTGYFEGAAELKPLLHIWSLSLEEQYYLFIPAILFFTKHRNWPYIILLMFSVSLLSCILLLNYDSSAAFYLLPTRAWELAIGSIAALGNFKSSRMRAALAVSFWGSLGILVVTPVFPTGLQHPGLDALLVCIATATIILRQHEGFNAFVATKLLGKIGNASYSLYLAHWPVMAFLNNAYMGKPDASYRLVGLVIGIAAGILLYVAIEKPFRHAFSFSIKSFGITLAASFALIAAQYGISVLASSKTDYSEARRINWGLSRRCTLVTDKFVPHETCMTSENPRILVWGDSYAMHLMSGIRSSTKSGIVQATQSLCGPTISLMPFNDSSRFNRKWAQGCLNFNRSVLEFIKSTDSIDTVVLSSMFSGYVAPEARRGLQLRNSAYQEVELGIPLAVQALNETISAVRSLGKRVVVIGPPASGYIDYSQCLERKDHGLLVLGPRSDCTIDRSEYESKFTRVITLLKELQREANVKVIHLSDWLCNEKFCTSTINGVSLYRDEGHLSYDGSVALGQKIGLGSLIDIHAH